MKIALVVPANLYFAPYVRIYTKVLDEIPIDYDIISWDRNGVKESNVIPFVHKTNKNESIIRRILNYYKFSQFVVKTVKQNKYDKLIIFTSQLSIFLYRFLKKKYKGAFVLDYRDLSIEQKIMFVFDKVLKISGLNVVSSPGFKKYLPDNYNYVLSHNFDIEILLNRKKILNCKVDNVLKGEVTSVSTIGGIRDYQQNKEIIVALENDFKFHVNFIGKGPSAEDLKKYSEDNNIKNVFFVGFYEKKDEEKYILKSDFMNIFYPAKKSHSSALSNRFYNALIYKRPMIVTTDSIQGDYVKKYKLGLILNTCDFLKDEIKKYKEEFNYKEFAISSDLLLEEFEKDYYIYVQNLHEFIKKTSDC